MNWHYQTLAKWYQFPIVILLMLGIFFRFANLEQKIYWEDEVYTSLRIAGYEVKQVTPQLFNGQEISIKDLQRYQQASPDKNAFDTIKVLAQEDTHPPLYFLLVRAWSKLFGSSAFGMRSLSALVSLLAIPTIYWFCLELFESPPVGWVSVALVAVSPIFVRYAQEARQYSLLVVLILLSSTILLRAVRLKTKFNWIAYGATVVLGVYTHLLFNLVLIAHGIYIAVIERFRLSKTLRAYLLSVAVSAVMFVPWIGLLVPNIQNFLLAASWIKQPLSFPSLARAWELNLSRIFISWNHKYDELLIYLFIPILILVIYSFLFLYQRTPQKVWLFILTIAAVNALVLILPDLILGGQRSRIAQYALPCYLSIQLAVAYLLATKITSSSNNKQQKIWQVITVILISASVLSCATNAQAKTWWGWSEYEVQTSEIVNQSPNPLLISDARLTQILPFSHKLNPKVRFLLLAEPKVPEISQKFSDVFLYNPSPELHSKFEQERSIKLELVYQFRDNALVISLYRIKPHVLS